MQTLRKPSILQVNTAADNATGGATSGFSAGWLEKCRNGDSDAEAFTTTALTGHVRIAKTERLIQAFLDEIDLRAIDQF